MQKSKRLPQEIEFLKGYLYSMLNFASLTKSVSENNINPNLDVISYLKYEKIPGDRVVCKFGEIGKKFYLIIRGKCSVLLPKQEKENLTQEEYYNYLLRLKKYKETDILLKVLINNKNIYPLEEEEFAWLRGEVDSLKGRVNTSPFEQYLFRFAREEIIEDTEKKEDSELDEYRFDIWRLFDREIYKFDSQKYEQIIRSADDYCDKVNPKKENNLNCKSNSWNFVKSIEKKNIIKKFKNNKENDKKPDLSFFTKEGKEVVVWVYHNINSLKKGDKFGDIALTSSSQKRTATIVTNTETHFGILGKKMFYKHLKEVSDKEKKFNMNIILSQKVFNSLNINIFQKNYFNQFVHRKLNRGDFLIKEGQEADRLFVIKDGNYEVSIKKANDELSDLVKKLKGESSRLFKDLDHFNGNSVIFFLKCCVVKEIIILFIFNQNCDYNNVKNI